MRIRSETVNDYSAVYAINASAFPTTAEADLVETLRKVAQPIVSLVAEEHTKIIGHILFSPVTLANRTELKIMGLAPMAVALEHQRRHIGLSLVIEGLVECTRLGFGAVVVLGHPNYYPRFGFRPATHFAIRSEYRVPDDAFMALELQPQYLNDAGGVVKYHDAFGKL